MASGNGTVWKILGFVVTVIIIASGIIYGYATMGHTVEDNSDDIAEIKPKVEEHGKYIENQ